MKNNILFLSLFLLISCSQQPAQHIDEPGQAMEMLNQYRSEILEALQGEVTAENVDKLVEFGLWEDAQQYLDDAGELNNAMKLVQAKLYFKQHRYSGSEQLVNEVLESDPGNRRAQLQDANLKMQAWNLEGADAIAQNLLGENNKDAEAGLIHGKVAMLQRDYDEAVRWAKQVQEWDNENAEGYLLEAESRFWAQDPAGAEPALVRALELNPFNADARFSYGYAIWRRVDATQLDDMAAQWNLAFRINPLNYLGHWHFGNGHTNLTYADYAEPSDSLVRARLAEADGLVAEDRLDDAIAITLETENEFPESVLPAMMRGSIYYMYYDIAREARLDSAETIFRSILERKQNYGPAHNGLAAVIKQRQFAYLDEFEELEQRIENTPVPEEDVFYEIFPDMEYYPGDRVKKMIAQQIGPSKAYLPLIALFNSDFALPPLHRDLAEAMGRSYFRSGTTFDNRQWMDIRGVGSGATGIEYLERGAHLERNVLAHEYAHLYHGRILTDRESRRIRALYHAAMENNRTLDYYASNNESEFFAQGYAGFLSEEKVHPLNHKSMNTREYILEKDPEYYAFLDSLLQKQEEYLAGNEDVFDNNWAQAYLTLAEQNRNNPEQAMEYLDTSLGYSADYIPSLIGYAEILAETGDFAGASDKINEARELDNSYAPLYAAEAFIIHRQTLAGELDFGTSIEQQSSLYDRALELETDLSVRAGINSVYRSRSHDYGRLAEAIEVAKQYLEDAPGVSTYLRDRAEEAEAFANFLRSEAGYSESVSAFFKDLVAQNPQQFELRRMYADVLYRAGRFDESLAILEEGQRILAAAGNERTDYALRIALIHVRENDRDSANQIVENINSGEMNFDEQILLAAIYAYLDEPARGEDVLESIPEAELPVQRAQLEYVKALLLESSGDEIAAIDGYRRALDLNPYLLEARAALIKLLDEEEAEEVLSEGEALAIPAGPDLENLLM